MDVGWADNDNFDGQSTMERSQWEYEHICRSLKDGNCDDVIRFLLADPRGRNKSAPKNRNTTSTSSPAAAAAVATSNNDRNVETVSTLSSSSSSSSSTSLAPKSTENSLCRSKSNSSSTSISIDASNSPTAGSTIDSQASPQPVHRKPPILPNRCSAVINLDKNRINAKRHRHRTKLLPRPISLPSSFNLLRNFRPASDSGAATETIDIALIKQLEDEIYRSRDEVRRPNKIHNANGTCANCQRCVATEPTQFVQIK